MIENGMVGGPFPGYCSPGKALGNWILEDALEHWQNYSLNYDLDYLWCRRRGEYFKAVLVYAFQKQRPLLSSFQKLRTPDQGFPWKGPWKLDFGGCSGALAKLALKRRFGLFLVPAKGGVL